MRIEGEDIAAGSAGELIDSSSAGEEVAPCATIEGVVSGVAVDGVVSAETFEGGIGSGGADEEVTRRSAGGDSIRVTKVTDPIAIEVTLERIRDRGAQVEGVVDEVAVGIGDPGLRWEGLEHDEGEQRGEHEQTTHRYLQLAPPTTVLRVRHRRLGAEGGSCFARL